MVKKIFHSADWQYILSKKEPFDIAFSSYIKDVEAGCKNTDEYENVLQVIVGDIFQNIHDNVKIDEFLAVKEMLKQMCYHSPTIIVGGNHDNKIDNPLDENDNLLKIIQNFDIYGLKYIKYSEVYEYHNLMIVNFSIYSDSKPPKAYKKYLNNDKINIALYHNSLSCAIDYGGKKYKDSPSLKIFDGFDAVMMGHIHKRQAFEFETGKYAVFSGSPYQRKASESFNEHGYVMWDIDNLNINYHFVDIENPHNIVCGIPDLDSGLIKKFKNA